MSDTRLYKVAVTPCGKYVHGTEYDALCLVLNATEDGGDGCSYVSIKPNKNVRPGTDSTVWAISLERGEKGSQGDPGSGFTDVDVTVDSTSGTPSAVAYIENETFYLQLSGLKGADGKSAYELAVEEGYTGTEEEWLASLHGADGTDGTDGTDGKSAYEIAVDEGFVGTEEQWLASLKGEQGNTGSSVDYPYELVNNLTTNDATKGLSAAQGKVLGDDLTQLEHEVDDIADKTEIIHRTHTPASVGKNKFNLAAVTDGVRLLAANGTEYAQTGYAASDYIDVEGQANVTLSFTVNITSGFVYCFYDGSKVYKSGTSATITTKDDTTGRYYLVVAVPEGAKYIRCSSQQFYARPFQCEYGNQVTAYEAYQYTPASTKTWIEESAMPLVMQSVIGGDLTKRFGTLASNATMEFDQDALKSFCLRFYGKFSSFSGILIGHGSSGSHSQYIKVDGTNITFFSGGTQGSSIAHGLTIASYIAVSIDVKSNCDYTIRIETLAGSYKRDMTYPSSWTGNEGKLFVTSVSTAFTLASLTFCAPFQKTKWLYGDSYVSNYSDKRWPYYIQNWGFDNMLINGCPGQASASAYVDWTSCLNHGTPKFAIWAMGMNDPDNGAINASWLSNVQNFLADCENRQIIPILCTIPCVPSYNHEYKNAWIKASGYRYIDFAEAVDAEEAGSTWLTGCLSTDNVHPTADGARLLACRALQDVPELMQE